MQHMHNPRSSTSCPPVSFRFIPFPHPDCPAKYNAKLPCHGRFDACSHLLDGLCAKTCQNIQNIQNHDFGWLIKRISLYSAPLCDNLSIHLYKSIYIYYMHLCSSRTKTIKVSIQIQSSSCHFTYIHDMHVETHLAHVQIVET